MPAAEMGTGRLKSRDARTACASLRQLAADGRAASEGGVPSEGNAAEGMLTERAGAPPWRSKGGGETPLVQGKVLAKVVY